jgi:uncharacterized protein YkwD
MQQLGTRILLLVAALTAALVAPVVAAGSASALALSAGMTKTEYSYATSVLGQLNAERKSSKLKPVRVNKYLNLAAVRHNRAMASVNVISHLLPGEPAFNVRQWRAGYHYKCWAGENLGVHGAMDRSAALALETTMFRERPPQNGHRLNILNKHYTEVGVAVLLDRVNHRLWLTVEFGSRC